MDALFITRLTNELFRVCVREGKGYYNQFTLPNGERIEGATETDVKKHLTSRHDYVQGREFRFPGIANGWEFEPAIKEAGFKIVSAKNFRGQTCRIVTL